jgi:glycosyltransferase involved in cell wall biosynthesis
MAMGAPIVSTAVMGTATVLRNVQSALVSEEDVPAFASRVAQLLRSPEERKRLSAAGPRDAAQWSAAALMNRVVDLYAHLATAGSQRVMPGPAEAAQA